MVTSFRMPFSKALTLLSSDAFLVVSITLSTRVPSSKAAFCAHQCSSDSVCAATKALYSLSRCSLICSP